jgi:hypothetical protein
LSRLNPARSSLKRGPIKILTYKDGGTVASNFSPILLIGGGAHYFEHTIKTLIPLVDLPEEPEDANPRGHLDLALSLEDVKAAMWERN